MSSLVKAVPGAGRPKAGRIQRRPGAMLSKQNWHLQIRAPPGTSPRFDARPGTPAINGLNESLLAPNNPNSVQPFRLDRSQFETADQDHVYGDEQRAFDSGLMDQFVEKVGRGAGPNGEPGGMVMGYYDGNTVTALWNYAQAFAMSDNSYSTTFGPSTPGALNLISGQTHGFAQTISAVTPAGTVIGDPQPTGDICSSRDNTTSIDPNNKNIGDLLNARNVTWGWFEGGFRDCKQTHANKAGVVSKDYIPHHEPFQYFRSTANPKHLNLFSFGGDEESLPKLFLDPATGQRLGSSER
jgi:phospholipase C